MATYYVYSGATGANNGTSWTDAYTAFSSAVTSASVDGDVIKIHKTHTEELAADTTYTFLAHVSAIVVDKDASDAPASMGATAWIGNSTTNRSITLAGAKKVYTKGLTLRVSGSSVEYIYLANSDGSHQEHEDCYLWLNTSDTSRISLGLYGVTNAQAFVKLINPTFRFGHASQSITMSANIEIVGGSVSSSGSAPTGLVSGASPLSGTSKIFNGVDLSYVTGTLAPSFGSVSMTLVFQNCKLGAGVTPLATQAAANKSGAEVYLFNCDSGDVHYAFGHYDALGETVAVTTPYANDGALYDGTNHVTWKITTTANATFYAPYVSPWIDKYNATLSAMTPYLEVLRDGSATAYQNDEVWGEFSYQGTSGSTKATFVNDRMTLLGTPADQAAGVGVSGWTGEQATAWSGKLAPGSSVTPAEIGHLRARICVGVASSTVYVDPTIRT